MSSQTVTAEINLSVQSMAFETPTPEYDNINAIENITLQEKKLEKTSPASSSIQISPVASLLKQPTGIIERCYYSLVSLDNFWKVYNKVKVDYMEIKAEKSLLERNNKQLRGMIRGILEALVLSKSQPNSSVPTRIPSRSRSTYSAPLRRIVLQ